ncbi:hypothetical protein IMG5_201710 [Ichthyophthirius multifiliis]|uniref:Uncharacterized protein n=1 Tax=Ichthyophthirius multifiliis TaxID=5932 RepID=G0R5W9_ICHMU|nr:hypothetical protein IMG5_201710 [Ichthyophthirius multifiliis]EGR27146.1 hypothetical protein IMG5_201710 [Ichthyophthirius multifiliis]|eukprot:XP_004024030.1 hypothetical protein IMG5_201710 [Ichthyophthirius multifiliis]
MIMSQGGSNFHLPLEQDIQAVYPMTEGLIFQFQIKKEIKFNDILLINRNYNKSKYSMYEENIFQNNNANNNNKENQLYSYVTINNHPSSSLKVLGILKRSDDSIIPWLDSYEKIVYVCKDLPILISYNRIQQRHAIHLIRANLEAFEKDSTKLNLNGIFYSLGHFSEGDFLPEMNTSYIVSEIFFEESIKVNMMQKCAILKSGNHGEFIIAMLIFDTSCYLKLYSLSFVNQGENMQNVDSVQNFQINALKNFVIINDVLDFFPVNLFQTEVSIPQIQDFQKQVLRRKNDKNSNFKCLFSNEIKLKQGIISFHKNGSFQLHNGLMKCIMRFDISIPAIIIGNFRQIKSINNFKKFKWIYSC